MDQEEEGQVQLQDQHHSRQGQGEGEGGDSGWISWGDSSLGSCWHWMDQLLSIEI